jgi:hypothetical protein
MFMHIAFLLNFIQNANITSFKYFFRVEMSEREKTIDIGSSKINFLEKMLFRLRLELTSPIVDLLKADF